MRLIYRNNNVILVQFAAGEMSDVALLNTIDSMLSTNDKATKLLWLKLASAKEEASKLSSLVADDDSMVNHGDIELTNTFKSEFMRLCWEAESDYSIKAMEAKKKAQQIAKQLQNDLLKSINLLVSGDYMYFLLL